MSFDELTEKLLDPGFVWTNMLRGTIARPAALDHYEECKAIVEKLSPLLNEVRRRAAKENVYSWKPNSGEGFTVTIDQAMWEQIESAI